MLDDVTRSSEILVGMIENSKAQSEIIIDKISGIFLIGNKKGNIKRGNWNLAKLLKVEFEYLINCNLRSLFTEDKWDMFVSKLQELDSQATKDQEDLEEQHLEINFNLSFNDDISQTYNWVVSFFRYPRSNEEQLYVINGTFIGELLITQSELEVLNKNLEAKVEERTRDLKETHDRLVRVAHSAGMAEIAANILHKVGNTLVSIQLPSYKVKRLYPDKQFKSFNKIIELIQNDPKEEYLSKLPLFHNFFTEEKGKLITLVEKIEKNLQLLQGILKDQEDYTRVEALVEKIDLKTLFNQALGTINKIQETQGIDIDVQFPKEIEMHAERNKLLNIFLNLLKNSVEALAEAKKRWIRVYAEVVDDGQNVHMRFEDSGAGIPKEDYYKAFNFGYSTKKGHDGMGLHTIGLLMEEMSGNIALGIADEGTGLKVELILPRDQTK